MVHSERERARQLFTELLSNLSIEIEGNNSLAINRSLHEFDESLNLSDMVEDYGWMDAWMFISDTSSTILTNRTIFGLRYSYQPDWMGMIKAEGELEKRSLEDTSPLEKMIIESAIRSTLIETISGKLILSHDSFIEEILQECSSNNDIIKIPSQSEASLRYFISFTHNQGGPCLEDILNHAADKPIMEKV